MKRIFFVLLIPLILITLASYQNNNNLSLIIWNLAYRGCLNEGELHYQVNLFNILPAGEAVFRKKTPALIDGTNFEYLSATAKTADYFRAFFSAQAYLDSYLLPVKNLPVIFRQKTLVSNKGQEDKEIRYDQDKHIMAIDGVERVILPQTHDPLSAMYTLCNMDFSKNKELDLNINTNQKNYSLSGKITSRVLKIDGIDYTVHILKAQIKRRDKNPYHKTHLTIYFLENNGKNLPVLVKVFASGAVINAKLIKVTP